MKYASLIVTYNRKDKLIGALRCLLGQTRKPQKIFLIDNCSTDGTPELLKREGILDNPLVDYQRMDKNYGGSGGFYHGIKYAMGFAKEFEYLSLSDDDAFFNQDYFEQIEKAAEEYPDCRAFCGTVRYEDGTIQTDHRRRISNPRWLKETEVPESEYRHNFVLDTFSFVGCVISVDILSKIGLPNKEYFIYYDDTEYSLRVRSLTNIINVSSAVVVHQTPKKSKNLVEINWKTYYGFRNAILMKKQHSDWKWLNLYFIWHQLKLNVELLSSSVFKGKRRPAMRVYNRAFKDGMAGIEGKQAPFLPGNKID